MTITTHFAELIRTCGEVRRTSFPQGNTIERDKVTCATCRGRMAAAEIETAKEEMRERGRNIVDYLRVVLHTFETIRTACMLEPKPDLEDLQMLAEEAMAAASVTLDELKKGAVVEAEA